MANGANFAATSRFKTTSKSRIKDDDIAGQTNPPFLNALQ